MCVFLVIIFRMSPSLYLCITYHRICVSLCGDLLIICEQKTPEQSSRNTLNNIIFRISKKKHYSFSFYLNVVLFFVCKEYICLYIDCVYVLVVQVFIIVYGFFSFVCPFNVFGFIHIYFVLCS